MADPVIKVALLDGRDKFVRPELNSGTVACASG